MLSFGLCLTPTKLLSEKKESKKIFEIKYMHAESAGLQHCNFLNRVELNPRNIFVVQGAYEGNRS